MTESESGDEVCLTPTWRDGAFVAVMIFDVGIDRRDYDRRSNAQRRVVEWLCVNPIGATPHDVASVAEISPPAAGRILQRLAAKWLVRRNELSRWVAAELLRHAPRLIRIG